jgi:hypothetical protein
MTIRDGSRLIAAIRYDLTVESIDKAELFIEPLARISYVCFSGSKIEPE